MRKLPCLSACALLLLASIGVRSEEPADELVYQGHTVADWIKAVEADDAHARAAAIYVLGMFGPEAKPAIPALLKALEESDVEVRSRAINALGRIGLEGDKVAPALAAKLKDMPYELAREAATVLDRFGKSAVAPLIEALKESKTRHLAIPVLGRIGPEAKDALPALKGLLKEKDALGEMHTAAVRAIRAIDPKDESGLPALLKLLEAKKYRPAALIEAIGEFGPLAKKSMPELLEMLKSPDKPDRSGYRHDPVKVAVAHALARIAPNDNELVELLFEMRKDAKSLYLANEALSHLPQYAARLLPDAEEGGLPMIGRPRRPGSDPTSLLHSMGREAVPPILAVAKDTEKPAEERLKALSFLSTIGQRTDLVAPVLIQMLKEKNKDLRKRAASMLTYMGSDARPAIPILQEWLKGDADLRDSAISALVVLDIDSPGLVPLYLDSVVAGARVGRVTYTVPLNKLENPKYAPNLLAAWVKAQPGSRTEIAKALGHMGPGAKEAAPVLREAMKGTDVNLKTQCAIALVRIDPSARDAFEVIDELLDIAPEKRAKSNPLATMRFLDELGPLAEPAVPALVKHIGRLDRQGYYYDAYRTLKKIGPAARAAAPVLIKALADAKDGHIGREIIETLGAIGPEGDGVMDTLIAALDSPDANIASAALITLGKMGPEAKKVSPKLLELLAAERPVPMLARPTPFPGIGEIRPQPLTTPRLPRNPTRKPPANRVQTLNVVDIATAYWRLEHKAGPVVPVLCMAIEGSAQVGRAASTTHDDIYALLGEIGPRAQPATPTLHRFLNQLNIEGRDRIAYLLWRIERKPEQIVPALTHALFEKDRRIGVVTTTGVRAAESLGKLGADAKSALPALIEAYHTTNIAMRKTAGEAIKAIDPEAAKKAGIP